ncbi:hypothetical protein FF011L_30250 [Roseimaritima multifibrata]|uniref:Uncharacterized protein n=1 Tax=Roseimaritima multifibrata TaxID=1930274 RepID=A0A517MH88_9BACT|nr:hypothetical protein FF011L_30250 [Roseimaritima multifibrata]
MDPSGESRIIAVGCGGCMAALGPGAVVCLFANEAFNDSIGECYKSYWNDLPWIHRQATKLACIGCVLRVAGPVVYRWVIRNAGACGPNAWEQIAVRSERVIRFSVLLQ